MLSRILSAVLFSAMSLSAQASELQDPINTALTLHAVDYLQTLNISRSCKSGGEFHETNPVLGRCPSRSAVTGYFLATGVAMYALHEVLPDEYKKYASYVWVSVEAGAVANNVAIGVKIGF